MNLEKKHPNYETCLEMVEAGWNAKTESNWYKNAYHKKIMTVFEEIKENDRVSDFGESHHFRLVCPAPNFQEIFEALPINLWGAGQTLGFYEGINSKYLGYLMAEPTQNIGITQNRSQIIEGNLAEAAGKLWIELKTKTLTKY